MNDFSSVLDDDRVAFFGNVDVGSGACGVTEMLLVCTYVLTLCLCLLLLFSLLLLLSDVSVDALRDNYAAVVLAYGCASDKKLSIAGEDLEGVFSAREFVNWYNGHLDYSGNVFPLHCDSKTTVVIGQGNVAIDVARVLLSHDQKHLTESDITNQAMRYLANKDTNNIQKVVVAGRRGPVQVNPPKILRKFSDLNTFRCYLA
jgi:NADPH-dependent glutamate synthase beta subunit-like oxidoreductase